ncbi:MAG: SMC-Scp complex subunit ScpB [Pseudomonadota bacterium]
MPLDDAVRVIEALLFASDGPLLPVVLKHHVGETLNEAVAVLKERYTSGGVTLEDVAGGFALRTAPDLAYLFEDQAAEPKKLSRAALETLAIIAYHQPVTRAEIEDIRGVAASKGTLDVLLETGWARMRGRRRTPGRPVTYGTTPAFLDQFGLPSLSDLPGLDELKGAGLLEAIPTDANTLGSMASLPGFDAEDGGRAEDPIDDNEIAEERSRMALWPDGDADVSDDQDADVNEPSTVDQGTVNDG